MKGISMETMNTFLTATAVVGILFSIYQSYRKPAEKTEKDVAIMVKARADFEKLCNLRHSGVDGFMNRLNTALEFIQKNDLKHIEGEMRSLKEKQIEIVTMLNERLPKKG